jgi:hypothetical protein
VGATYITGPEVDAEALKARARHRRLALNSNGCQTYEIGMRASQPAILCLCCGLGSANENDIHERYCGFCHEFHSEERPA